MKTTTNPAATSSPILIPNPTVIAVTSVEGSVGKTTMSRHLLMPAIPGARLLRVESLNSSGSSQASLEVSARDFDEVLGEIGAPTSSMVLDIGASNLQGVLDWMADSNLAAEAVDCWLIPARANTKGTRHIESVVATVANLTNVGVPAERIVVAMNCVSARDVANPERRLFPGLREQVEDLGATMLRKPLVQSDLVSALHACDGTVEDLNADATDYRALSLEAAARGDTAAQREYATALIQKSMAPFVERSIRAVRGELFEHLSQRTGLQAA